MKYLLSGGSYCPMKGTCFSWAGCPDVFLGRRDSGSHFRSLKSFARVL